MLTTTEIVSTVIALMVLVLAAIAWHRAEKSMDREEAREAAFNARVEHDMSVARFARATGESSEARYYYAPRRFV